MAGLVTIFSGLKLAETSISKVLSKKGTRIFIFTLVLKTEDLNGCVRLHNT